MPAALKFLLYLAAFVCFLLAAASVRARWASRDADAVQAALADLGDAARGRDNLLVPMREALRQLATVGEVCDALRAEFGTYRPPDTF